MAVWATLSNDFIIRNGSIDATDVEMNGLTDSMADAPTLGDVISDMTQSDTNGDAPNSPDDPDDRPQAADDPAGPDGLRVDHSDRTDRASGASSSRHQLHEPGAMAIAAPLTATSRSSDRSAGAGSDRPPHRVRH
ncbi:MAG: hypothetical protein RQ833_09670 [Sphingomonadaceae bacterium]|nr:hypothetical protein [Sphingomonadaceae bacterium]